MKLQTLLLCLGMCKATSITAWGQPSCTDPKSRSPFFPAPYKCYYFGAFASAKVSGLGEKDSYKVFSDPRCRTLSGVIAENDTCRDVEFMSYAYTPALEDDGEREINMPDDETEIMQQEIHLCVDGLMPTTQSLQQWFAQHAVALKGRTG